MIFLYSLQNALFPLKSNNKMEMNVMLPGGQIQDGSFENLRPRDCSREKKDGSWELDFMGSASFLDVYLTGTIPVYSSLFWDMKKNIFWEI